MFFSKWFGKKEMNIQAAGEFWGFFEQEQAHFMEVLAGYDSEARRALIQMVDQKLCPVFPYEKPENIDFQFGSHHGVYEFIMFHGGQMPLAKDMYRLCEMMPESIRRVWTVSLIE